MVEIVFSGAAAGGLITASSSNSVKSATMLMPNAEYELPYEGVNAIG